MNVDVIELATLQCGSGGGGKESDHQPDPIESSFRSVFPPAAVPDMMSPANVVVMGFPTDVSECLLCLDACLPIG